MTRSKRAGKLRFVVVSPRQDVGGAIALHTLCYEIEQLGYECKFFLMNGKALVERNSLRRFGSLITLDVRDGIKQLLVRLGYPTEKAKKMSFKGYVDLSVPYGKRKFLPFVSKDTIVVYPEVCYGNPLHAKNVVRWFLYHNRYHEEDGAFGSDDLFFCYRTMFNDEKLNPTARTMRVSHYNLDLYQQTNYGERSGTCYVVRKGSQRDDLPDAFDGPVIDSLPESEKVKVFNLSEYCVSYDTQTAYSEIAALCGCISVVVPEPGKSRENYEGPEDLGYGVAYGFSDSEIEHAIATRDRVKGVFEAVNRSSREAVANFIGVCEEYFRYR